MILQGNSLQVRGKSITKPPMHADHMSARFAGIICKKMNLLVEDG
jgi:hypothetical protein